MLTVHPNKVQYYLEKYHKIQNRTTCDSPCMASKNKLSSMQKKNNRRIQFITRRKLVIRNRPRNVRDDGLRQRCYNIYYKQA